MITLPKIFNQSFILNFDHDARTSFSLLDFLPSVGNELNGTYYSASFNQRTNKIELAPMTMEDKGLICVKRFTCFDTSRPAGKDTLRFLKYYDENDRRHQMVQQRIEEVQEAFSRIDLTNAYEAILSTLWYGSIPCSTVYGISGQGGDDGNGSGGGASFTTAVLKYCQWQGIPIECAAIFTTFPTDSGVCCAFNLKAAEEIYKGTIYPRLVTNLQEFDKSYSRVNITLPDWYTSSGEPKSLPGSDKGLFVMLDAHSDMFAPTSLEKDYTSFKGLISYSGSFPYMAQESFEIRPGYHNFVSLTGSLVNADVSMRNLDPNSRKCIFYDESSNMNIYQNYTYANCLFECSLLAAHAVYGCFPWYFPATDDNIKICNPWETQLFLNNMKSVKGERCTKCLPECNNIIYESSVVTIPFRQCDLSNMEMSLFCKISQYNQAPFPKKYYAELNNISQSASIDSFYPTVKSNTRFYGLFQNNSIFKNNPETYDAFETDIAVVEIYFRKASIIEIGLQSKMGWIDYLSTVGGLLGLVLGMGFVSFIELVWLGIRLVAWKLRLDRWIV